MNKVMSKSIAAAAGVCLAISTTGIATAGADSRPPTPVLTEADDKGSYVSVKWSHNSNYAKVEVYRDSRDGNGLRFVRDISSGNVLNDYSGDAGDIYQLIAYNDDGGLSHRSANRTATAESVARNGTTKPRPVKPKPVKHTEPKSQAKELNDRLFEDFRQSVLDQREAAAAAAAQKQAEEWDRKQAEARKRAAEHKSSQDDNQRSDGTRSDGSGGATRSGDAGDGLRG